MPLKRRSAKRRLSAADELLWWGCYWDCGCFLLAGAEDALGLADGEDVDAAAREAWARLGHLYDGDGAWARQHFGEP